MTALEQMRAALEEIDNLIGLIDCADKHNLALLPLFLEQQKRALAALDRMEQPFLSAVEHCAALLEGDWEPSDPAGAIGPTGVCCPGAVGSKGQP